MTEVTFSVRRSIWRAISDRNPFYLLSAVCMLFGCIALTNSSSWSPIRLNRLLILIATLNFYELLLVGLALFLIVKRGLRRDGTILLILEAFFLVDVTFLNSEIFSTNLRIGLIVNALLFLLAIVKVAVIFRGLGISLASGAFATAIIELAMLFALPGVFKRIATDHNGSLPAAAIYAAWWSIGLLPVVATLLMRSRHYFTEPQRARFHQSRQIVGLLVILPVVSLLAHICTSNWIYNVRWYPSNVSPLILGLAVAIGGYDAHVATLGKRMKAHFVLPILALFLSGQFPSLLVFHLGPLGFVSTSLHAGRSDAGLCLRISPAPASGFCLGCVHVFRRGGCGNVDSADHGQSQSRSPADVRIVQASLAENDDALGDRFDGRIVRFADCRRAGESA